MDIRGLYQLLSIFNAIHLTLAPGSKTYFTDQLVEFHDKQIVQKIKDGSDGKLNGDNLDLRVTTNDIRLDNKCRDYHFFASSWIPDRIKLSDISDDLPLKDIQSALAMDFLPSAQELSDYKEVLSVVLGRFIFKYISAFNWLKDVVPDHIEHPFSKEMSEKSLMFILPVMLKNEQSYSDCVSIMDSYIKQIKTWYSKAGRGESLEKLKVPIGGDQLTRVRLQGAKSLRAWSYTSEERLEMLDPIIIELFHTMMDFLEKMCKKFLKLDKMGDQGTLANIKLLIQRTDVNANVKSRYQAHEQFIRTSGISYLLLLVMKIFNMKDLQDTPMHQIIPDDIRNQSLQEKKEVFSKIMDLVLEEFLILPFEKTSVSDKKQVMVDVSVLNKTSRINIQPVNGIVQVAILVKDKKFVVTCSAEQLCTTDMSVQLPGLDKPVRISKVVCESTDELNSYTVNFMNWFSLFLCFDDAIKEGNMLQTQIIMKLLIPFFYSHSPLSKYMTECLDYVMKTEFTLSPKMSMKVKAAAFVNTSGREGHNKAADMQKENEVMLLKSLIKGLGANKSEDSIVKISKSSPVLEDITSNLVRMTGVVFTDSRHHERSLEQDISLVVTKLTPVNKNPWVINNDRKLSGFPNFDKSPFSFDIQKFEETVLKTKDRLIRDISLPVEDEI